MHTVCAILTIQGDPETMTADEMRKILNQIYRITHSQISDCEHDDWKKEAVECYEYFVKEGEIKINHDQIPVDPGQMELFQT